MSGPAPDRVAVPTLDTPFSLGVEEILDFVRERRDRIEQPIPPAYATAYWLAEQALSELTRHPDYLEERERWRVVPAEEWARENGTRNTARSGEDGKERARTSRLTEALRQAAKEMKRADSKLPEFNAGVSHSILYDAEYRIARVLAECGAGTEQPA